MVIWEKWAHRLSILYVMAPLCAFGQLQPPDHDKTEGERIELRRQWFAEIRGLDRVEQASQYRLAAAMETRDRMLLEANVDSAVWTAIGPSPMSMLNWTMGHVSGRVSALAVDPVDRDILFLGAASGGLWKSTNGGVSWSSLFDFVGTQTIGAVVLDPSNRQTLWVGTGEQAANCDDYFGQGLFRSTDGGATFYPRNGSGTGILPLSFISAIAVDPTDSDHILVGGTGRCVDGDISYGGLYRSTNGGTTWQQIQWGTVQDMVFNPEDPDVVYVAIGGYGESPSGIYKSTDGGVQWSRLANFLAGIQLHRLRLAMAPSDADVLYALVNRPGRGTSLYRTTDAGSTWSLQNATACEGQCWYNLCLAVDPTDANKLRVGSIRFASSSNAGVTLTYETDYWGSTQSVHQDTHVLQYDPADANRFWIGTDGGLWRSEDGGASYQNLNGNLNITQFYDIAVHPTDTNTVFGGSQDNSSERTVGNQLWEVTLVSGDGFCNVVDTLSPDVVIQTSYPWNGLPSLYRSTQGGQPNTFSFVLPTGLTVGEPWPWKTPLTGSLRGRGDAFELFIGSNRVYRSSDVGDTWTALSSTALGTRALSSIVAVPFGQTIRVFAGTLAGELFRCDDALAASPQWTPVHAGLVADAPITDVSIDPTQPQHVFVTQAVFDGDSLSVSHDGGGSWLFRANGLPPVPANAVQVDSLAPQRIYVGTDVGMFRSTDGGLSFHTMMQGLPLGAVISDLEVSGDGLTLVAGTYGRGAWRVPIGPTLSLDAGVDGTGCVSANFTLAASANGIGGSASWQWQVASGPDTNEFQFDQTTVANPVFTPTAPGIYQLSVQVQDQRGFSVEDTLTLNVTSNSFLWQAQMAGWLDHGHQVSQQVDRDMNGVVDVRDMVLQVSAPICP